MDPVLIVEDSAAMRTYLRAMLEAEGVDDVVEAPNALEALRVLARQPVRLVLLDINMPTLSGLELLSMIRQNPTHGQVPVVMVTTEGRASERQRAEALGVRGYLTKPFTAEALRAVLA